MTYNVRMISVKVLVTVLLLLFIPAPSVAQLYGIPVSNVENISVPSPNKEWLVSVKINNNKPPILTIQRESEGCSKELTGVSRSGWVLWSPDSKAFAFTDAAFANHYSVYLYGVGPTGIHCRNISSAIEKRVKKRLPARMEIDKMYSKAMKWHSPDKLIVGVHTVTSPAMKPEETNVPVHYWFGAFWVNVRTGRIIKELTPKQAFLELGANLEQLEW